MSSVELETNEFISTMSHYDPREIEFDNAYGKLLIRCDKLQSQRDELLELIKKINCCLHMVNNDEYLSKHIKFTWEIDECEAEIAKCEADHE